VHPEVKEIITKAMNVAKYAKAEYKVKADAAKTNNESTGGWELDNGYLNNSDCKPAGTNASRCIDLTEVLARIKSIADLAPSDRQDSIDAIKMHWRQCMDSFLPKPNV
jgi:hypothetical protein